MYGGLGNQMFQYAFFTALNACGTKNRLSFSGYLYYKHHNGFDLCRAFNLVLPVQLKLLNFFLLHGGIFYKNRAATFLFRKFVPWYQAKKYKLFREKEEFKFDASVFEQQNVFFTGTWQSEKYFKNIAETIKQKFIFKVPKDEANQKLIEKITNCNAVSIHIRRGDYLSQNWYSSHGVIKSTGYYDNAIHFIESKINNPYYFIFSDDINWVKENLKLINCTYINNNTANNSYADMYLMSLCKHNIIANSTFSWWGAWLNCNENKIVVMPEKWLNTKDCNEIYPEEWIKLKV